MNDPRFCSARSSRTGEPCRNAPIAGATVCRVHGGAAPQVKAAAARRLADAADTAVDRLVALLHSDDERVALRAALAIIDRVDLEPVGTITPELIEAEIARLEWELGLEAGQDPDGGE